MAKRQMHKRNRPRTYTREEMDQALTGALRLSGAAVYELLTRTYLWEVADVKRFMEEMTHKTGEMVENAQKAQEAVIRARETLEGDPVAHEAPETVLEPEDDSPEVDEEADPNLD